MEVAMKKKKLIYFAFIFFTFLLHKSASALETTTGRVSAELGLRLRSDKTTSSNSIITIPYNTIITINNYYDSGNGCDDKWLDIIYESDTSSYKGFVCSAYIEDITTKGVLSAFAFDSTALVLTSLSASSSIISSFKFSMFLAIIFFLSSN